MTQEEIILAEAEKLFLEKGFNGTSTTEIAKRAGCNQALVHYYFRTKEQLFLHIFIEKMEKLVDSLSSYLRFDRSFQENMLCIIDGYFEFLNSNRQIPFMIINELILNPDRSEFIRRHMVKHFNENNIFDFLNNSLEREIAEGSIRKVELFDVVAFVISLTVMTFISLPIYSSILSKDDQQMNEFILHRREEVKESLIRYLKA